MSNQNFTGDGKQSTKVSRAVSKAESHIYRTILWNLGNPVKNIVNQHPTDPRRMVLLREQYAELKQELLLCCCNSAWMKNGGLILWNVTYCYLRKVQNLLSDWKTPCERRFGEPFKGPLNSFGSMVEYHPISANDSRDSINLARKCYLENFVDMHCMR